jgi:uncharacterized membrane protein
MSDLLFAAGLLIHTLGLIIWAGGEVWITVLVAKAQKSEKPHGQAFVLEIMPTANKVMWAGLMLAIIGGAVRIIGANALGIYTDLGNLWSAMMVTKHALIVVFIITSAIITWSVKPVVEANMPGPNSPPNEKFQRAMGKLGKLSMTNFFLTIVVIVISVGAVTI